MPKTKDTPSQKLYKSILRYNTAASIASWAGLFFLATLILYLLASVWSVFAAHAAGEVTGFIYYMVTILTFLNPLSLFVSMWIGTFADVPLAMAAVCMAELAAYFVILAFWLICKAGCRKSALEAADEDTRRGASDLLIERMQGGRRVSGRLLLCLADLRDERAVEVLAGLLGHKRKKARLAVTRALARTGDYRAVRPLEALRDASAGGSKEAKVADRALTRLQREKGIAAQKAGEAAGAQDEGIDRSEYTTAPFNSYAAGRRLIETRGAPKEVLIREDAAAPGLLEAVLTFAVGSRSALGGFAAGAGGMRQEFLLKLLAEAGFAVSAEQLENMRIPERLTKNAGTVDG